MVFRSSLLIQYVYYIFRYIRTDNPLIRIGLLQKIQQHSAAASHIHNSLSHNIIYYGILCGLFRAVHGFQILVFIIQSVELISSESEHIIEYCNALLKCKEPASLCFHAELNKLLTDRRKLKVNKSRSAGIINRKGDIFHSILIRIQFRYILYVTKIFLNDSLLINIDMLLTFIVIVEAVRKGLEGYIDRTAASQFFIQNLKDCCNLFCKEIRQGRFKIPKFKTREVSFAEYLSQFFRNLTESRQKSSHSFSTFKFRVITF